MKAFVNERKYPAQENICRILTSCVQNAVTYQLDVTAPLGGRIVIDLVRSDSCWHAIEVKE